MTDITEPDLTGRAALVTGASRGIGHAIAAELLARGAAVTITARKPDELAAAAEQLVAEARGRRRRPGARRARQRRLGRGPRGGGRRAPCETFGNLAILVNNTGINPTYGPLMDADLDAVRKIFDVNVVAALGFVQLGLPGVDGRARRRGGQPGVGGRAALDRRDRRLRGVEGRADPAHRGAGLAARPGDPGERGGPGRGQDQVRRRRCTPTARRGRARPTRCAARPARRTWPRWSGSWSPTRRPGSPARRSGWTAGSWPPAPWADPARGVPAGGAPPAAGL